MQCKMLLTLSNLNSYSILIQDDGKYTQGTQHQKYNPHIESHNLFIKNNFLPLLLVLIQRIKQSSHSAFCPAVVNNQMSEH